MDQKRTISLILFGIFAVVAVLSILAYMQSLENSRYEQTNVYKAMQTVMGHPQTSTASKSYGTEYVLDIPFAKGMMPKVYLKNPGSMNLLVKVFIGSGPDGSTDALQVSVYDSGCSRNMKWVSLAYRVEWIFGVPVIQEPNHRDFWNVRIEVGEEVLGQMAEYLQKNN